MENLIKTLQQWATENEEERDVLVFARDEEKSGCAFTGTYANVAKAIAHQVRMNPEILRVLLMGLFAASKNNRFFSLRLRLVKWLLI